eukprot:Skav228100  [mRNA]  locus=scaffold4074:82965:85771:+ [translate_table: standard]
MAPPSARWTQGSTSSRCSARSWTAALTACPLALAVPKFARRLGRNAAPRVASRRSRRPSRAKTSALDDFDLLDENGDGSLSREEFAKRRELPQTQVTSSGAVLEQKLQGFKQYLVECEETGPPQYRVAESFLVALGTFCFVTRVVSPDLAAELFLAEVEDVVNVSFFIKFLLLFWINEFDISWLFTGSGALDVASCLPVLCIPARLIGGPSLEQTFDLLQIGRFLRLLRVALPSDSGRGRWNWSRTVPVSQQILAVLLSLLGTTVISATVLYSFEHDPSLNLAKTERTFEDALIYMVNIFAGRDPPWYPGNPQAKIASVIATTSGIIFIPFLVGRSAELFMSSDALGTAVAPAVGRLPGQPAAPSGTGCGTPGSLGSLDLWVAVLAELDDLEVKNLLPSEDLRRLRKWLG